MQGAVEEMLRWVSPIKNMARTATHDVELAGATDPEGQEIMLLYPSANRDRQCSTTPTTFDITRSPNPHMAFGFGAHFCLGQPAGPPGAEGDDRTSAGPPARPPPGGGPRDAAAA